MSAVTTTNNILVGENWEDVGVSSNYEYNDKDWLTKITSNGNSSLEYSFEYDAFGRTTCIKVGNQPLIKTEYDGYGRPTTQTYGNSQKLTKSYDTLDRVTEIRYNNDNSKKLQFYYSNSGNLTILIDHFSETKTRYIYDLAGRVVDTKVYKTTGLSDYNYLENWVKYYYDATTGYVTGVEQWTPETGGRHYSYRYGNKDANEMPDQVYGVSLNGVEKQSYSFDNLGRLTNKVVNVSAGKNITYSYAYKDVGDNGTTTVVETFVNDLGTYEYEYDGNGNITKETFTASGATAPTKVTVYEYDKLGQLNTVRINGDNRYAYRYDASGNIVNIGYIDEADVYYQTNYTYGNANWRDQLTNFNGEAITYDEIGNPLSYRGATLTWQNGRQLAKYQKGSMIAEYKYDGNGNRISKTHNGNTYEFIYNGSNLVAMTNTGTTLFNWICDENGDYLGFTYCGVEYYYIRNLQNDVIGIKNPSGTVVVEYEYDPFGKVIATKGPLADTLGKLNPIRYRGYFYDTETGFYFLQSRYYDPETCRFINADCLVSGVGGSVLGYNQFTYCFNNPINMEDPNGNRASLINKFIGFVTAVLAVVKSKTKIANVVTKTHTTTEIEKIDLGVGFGEVGFSSNTIISENEEPAFLCAYSDVGLEESRHGVSVNEDGVLGAGFGFSDEGNVFVNAQLASVLHAEVSLGIDGVGGSIGVDVGKTSYDFEIKIGWGTLALIPLIPLFNSGEESNSPAYAY